MEIKDEIDPRMTRYVDLALNHAEEISAEVVIIEMDTYGGVLTDAKDIVDKIMAFKKPVWVFINSDAASAGALISIACDSIYMSPGCQHWCRYCSGRYGRKSSRQISILHAFHHAINRRRKPSQPNYC